jgi:hypothetical protein
MASPDMGNPSPLGSDDGADNAVSPGSEVCSHHLTPASLSDQHWSLPSPTDVEFEKLRASSIDEAALWQPWPIRVANVRFFDHLFDFDSAGQRAFILRADDCGYASDLVVWRGDKIATHHGVGFCLGDRDQISNPATCALGGKLRIHRTPLEWLKADRRGIVPLRPAWLYGELKDCPAIAVADDAHRLELLKLLEPPKVKARFFLDVAPGRAAAK